MSTSSAELPDIRLPADLRPSDGRFGSGPSKVRREAIEALTGFAPTYLGTSHRRSGVRSVVGRVRAGLSELFALPEGYEVVLGNGGAALFWDVAIFGLIEQRSQHLSFGSFSASFAAGVAAASHLDDPEVIEAPPGTHPLPRPNRDVDVYALTHNETSTGVAMEVRRPSADDALVVVDATSAAGGLRVDPKEFDAYYFSPQKCFASDAGIWLALCSPAAVARAQELAGQRWAPRSLSLAIAIDGSRRDETYNTPALATLFLLAHEVEWMLSHGGLAWAAERCDTSAAVVYRWAEASDYARPFVVEPSERSSVVATVDLDEKVDATAVTTVLRANGIVDTEPYRGLARNQLRIALFPAIEPADVTTLTRAIDYIVDALS